MGRSRFELHEILCDILGSRNCYFSPPSGFEMKYPCICYELSRIRTDYANNRVYKMMNAYSITVMDEDPDSQIAEKILTSDYLNYCSFDRSFVVDGLYHVVLSLYF